MADSNTIEIGALKALSKEKRQVLSANIRKDPELWNVVNGIGGLSENSGKARFQGTITKDGETLPQANIQIAKAGVITQELMSNQLGYFKIDLASGEYNLKIIFQGQSEDYNIKAMKGETSTINHNFEEKDGKL